MSPLRYKPLGICVLSMTVVVVVLAAWFGCYHWCSLVSDVGVVKPPYHALSYRPLFKGTRIRTNNIHIIEQFASFKRFPGESDKHAILRLIAVQFIDLPEGHDLSKYNFSFSELKLKSSSTWTISVVAIIAL